MYAPASHDNFPGPVGLSLFYLVMIWLELFSSPRLKKQIHILLFQCVPKYYSEKYLNFSARAVKRGIHFNFSVKLNKSYT